jgi:hypothetical protein
MCTAAPVAEGKHAGQAQGWVRNHGCPRCSEAEAQLVEAGHWKGAVQMYRRAGAWEDVVRVAKAHGGPAAAKQVAYAWAVHLEVEEKKGPAAKARACSDLLDWTHELDVVRYLLCCIVKRTLCWPVQHCLQAQPFTSGVQAFHDRPAAQLATTVSRHDKPIVLSL